jgi:HEAT repeat protein
MNRLESTRRAVRGRIVAACGLLAFVALQTAFAGANEAELANASGAAERAHLILKDSLKSQNPETRLQGVQALGLIGPHQPYQSELTAMLDDSDVQVRVSTVFSLADLKDDSVLPALRKAMQDPVAEVSFAATRALWNLKQTDGHEGMYAVLRGERDASSGFVKNEERAAVHAMHTPRQMIAFGLHLAIGLAHVPGLGTGVSSAQGILSDQNVTGRAAAALLIGKDDDPRVVPALRTALIDKDDSVRAAAAHALAVRDDPAIAPDLVPLMEDKALPVQVRAAAGYLRLTLLPHTTAASDSTAQPQTPKPDPRRPARARRAH